MSETLCRVTDLSVFYRGHATPALSNIALDIIAGERLAIVGESGSGKSTFVRCLAGLLPAGAYHDGKIEWTAEHPARLGRDIGFVFQDASTSLNPLMRIGVQVAEGAKRHLGMTWTAAYDYARTLLQHVHPPNASTAMRAYPHQFSGGQRQRIAIAAAIASKPSILIADEATSALDTVIQAEIAALLDGLVRERAMTLLFVTHDIALASNLADRIAVFKDGNLMEIGPVATILNEPACDYTRNLISANRDLTSPPLVTNEPQP